jgi:hypothetical protein
LLQLIAAILSLLLLAGAFGSGMDDDNADAPGIPAGNAGAAQDGIDFGDLPQTNP